MTPARLSRPKKLVFSVVLLVVAVVLVELGLHAIYLVARGRVFPFHDYDAALRRVATTAAGTGDPSEAPGEFADRRDIYEVIHPYLGYVRDPRRSPETSYLGFPRRGDDDDPFRARPDDTFVVAVFGGSFAEGLSLHGREAMRRKLEPLGMKLRVVSFSMGGFKQPQQLFTLAYLLTHGARIDVVVNLDGFNEVALPPAENVPKGVNMFYPRSWYYRMLGVHDRDALRQVAAVVALEDSRRRWATTLGVFPSFSIVRNVAWRTRDRSLEREITESVATMRKAASTAGVQRFVTTGPDLSAYEPANLYERIANHWKTCSLLMKALADSRKIPYIHLLQPNQYVPNSKSMTTEELTVAVHPRHPLRPGVVEGYPLLTAAGRELRAQGVDFHDLTMIYRDIKPTIYADLCCHPNQRGYELVAEHLAGAIARATRVVRCERFRGSTRETTCPG